MIFILDDIYHFIINTIYMGQPLILRRSSVAGKKPTIEQIELGEISINTKDGKLYFLKSGDTLTVEEIITTNAINQGNVTINGDVTSDRFIGDLVGTADNAKNSDLLDNFDSTHFATVESNIFNGNQDIIGDLSILGQLLVKPLTGDTSFNEDGTYIYTNGNKKDLFITKNNDGVQNTLNLKWLEGNLYSGLLSGGVISTIAGSTTFNILAGSGIIVTLKATIDDEFDTTIKYVTWDTKTNIPIYYLNNHIQSFIAIDENGDVVQQTEPFVGSQYNDLITLGTVIHQNLTTINASITYPNTAYGYKQRTYDFIKAFGPLKLSGFIISPISNLSLNVSTGIAWSDGRNYEINPNNPSYITDTGTTVSKIFRYHQVSGTTFVQDTNNGAGYTTIDPSNYNLNGTLTPVPGNGSNKKWTLQRVFWFPNSATKGIIVYYGNTYYNSATDATANLPYETFFEIENTKQNAIYLGALALRNDADFTNSTTFSILPGGIFRNVGGSGGGTIVALPRFADLTDVDVNLPNNGDLVSYNSSTLKWEHTKTFNGDFTFNGAIIKSGGTSSQYLMADGSTSTISSIISSTGTTNYIPKWTSTTTLGNSLIYDDGNGVGIGTTLLTGFNLRVSKNISGASTSVGIYQNGTVQSDVTTAYGFRNDLNTQASGFTLTTYQHYSANQINTLGSGSSITSQIGFYSGSLSGATNNYGFYGNIASGTNRWNLYMGGTADNYFAGSLGIGTNSLTGFNLRVSKNITGASSSVGIQQSGQIQSDVSAGYGFRNELHTSSSTNLTSYHHFYAKEQTIASGTSITNQYGFYVDSSLLSATSNYAYFGNLTFGANMWNLYMNGTASNYVAGSLGIGNTTLTGYSLRIAKNITGALTSLGVYQNGTVQSDVTTLVYGIRNDLVTQATAFTLSSYQHFTAFQGTIGAGSAVSTQYGFIATSSLTGATNNYGFYGNIPSSANNVWNLYMIGTANNYLAGSLGIGSTSLSNINLRVSKNISGSVSSYGISQQGTIQSDVTTGGYGYNNTLNTQATSFTITNYYHFYSNQNTLGVGSVVTNQYGYYVSNTLSGATNNFGFYGDIVSGSNRWNIYIGGTAKNYFNGTVLIGTTTDNGTDKVQISGSLVATTLKITGGTSSQYLMADGSTSTISSLISSTGTTNYIPKWTSTTTIGDSIIYDDGTNIGLSTLSPQYPIHIVKSTPYFISIERTSVGNHQIGVSPQIENSISDFLFDAGQASSGYLFRSRDSSNSIVTSLAISRNGNIGIGGVTLNSYSLRITKNITGGVISYGISNEGQIQIDVTSQVRMYQSFPTQISGATLTGLYHYIALQNTISGTVTNQYGFYVDATLISATNNYGFYSNIASGTNRWNLFMSGTASNYLAGSVGIGNSTLTGYSLRIGKTMTGAVVSYGISNEGQIQSDVTSQVRMYQSLPSQISGSTLTHLYHYIALQNTISGTVTNQYGFLVDSTLVDATNNYAFRSTLTAGTGRWNIYMDGTANNYIAGSVGVGSTTLTGYNLRIGKTITGAVTSYGITSEGQIQSDVTTTAYYYRSLANAQATTFSLSNIMHYHAGQTAFNSGTTVTSQYGFITDATMSGATNNYSYYGQLTSGTGRWNLYMAGTASNYFAGNLGIGSTSLTGYNLRIGKNISGAVISFGISQEGNVISDVTTQAFGFYNAINTQATTFTLSQYFHFIATQQTIGSGSTVTSQYGFHVSNVLTGATNNYGYRASIPSATNNWNVYIDGTAKNYFNGTVLIGTTTDSGYKLDINGTTRISGILYADNVGANVRLKYDGSLDGDGFLGLSNSTGNLYLSNYSATRGLIISTNGNIYNIGTGAFGIGTSSLTGYNFRVSNNIGGATTSYGITSEGNVQSGVTTASAFLSSLGAASGSTITTLRHYGTGQGTFTGTVTNQYGFYVHSSLVDATNNYGFYGDIPSGTGDWNLYMNGTANNYLAGSLGIGSSSLSTFNLRLSKTITGGTSAYGIYQDSQIQSDVTATVMYLRTISSTQATTFTLNTLIHYGAYQGTFGSGSTVTNQYGFLVDSTMTGATNNYAYYSSLTAGTGRWNLYLTGTANNYIAGSLGVGATTLTAYSLRIAKNITGAINSFAVVQEGVVQSDVTTQAYGFLNYINTQATTFTLSQYYHYTAHQTTIGAGSTVTSQYGFTVASSMTGATNNYGFVSNLASASSNWNLYISGSANNYLNGSLGIGTTTLTGYNLNIGKNITGASSSYAISQQGTVQSDVTYTAGFWNVAQTQATTFTLPTYQHYGAYQNPFGAGSTVTSQIGFNVTSSLTGATNNYGFYGNIASGTNMWNIYMAGTANNYLAGSLGVGATTLTAYSLRVAKNITGAVTSFGIAQEGVVQSSVTTTAFGYINTVNTQTASFTLGSYVHYYSFQNTLGSGSTITNQYGFYADSSLSGATNNYGFYGNIASGTNRWNLYMIGTANNYLAGSLAIGVTSSLTGYSLRSSKVLTGAATNYGFSQEGSVQSDSTNAVSYYSTMVTQATTFTLSNYYHYFASQSTIGSGSTITNQYGVYIHSNASGATNNYAFHGNLTSATNNWNIYMAGTAKNYFNGTVLIGTTTDNGTDKLQVNGSVISTQFKLSALNTAPASASATGTLGDIRIDSSYIYICTGTNTWKRSAIITW